MKAFSQILSERPKRKVAVMAFGRMNPPTRGHSVVVQTVMDEARRLHGDHFVFVSKAQDAKENPLDIDTKMGYLSTIFPDANLVSEATTPWDAVLSLCEKGYTDIVLVTGDDRVERYARIAEYKGRKAEKDGSGRSYSFESFSVVVAGDPREDGGDGISSVRSSRARKAAWEGDYGEFSRLIPTEDGTIAERMYNDVRRGMGLTEQFVAEARKDAVHVLCLTSAEGDIDGSTVEKIEKSCKRQGLRCDVVKVKFAHVDMMKANHSSVVIENIDGEGKKVEIDPTNTVAIARGGVMNSEIGVGLMTVLQNHGVFMVNERGAMDLCANKLQTAIALQRNGLPHPRTAFVADEKSIPDAMKAVGGKYPVVVKTLTGAEGIGVSIIESEKSLTSVLQSLWKFGAEIILQEFIPGFKNDVRSIVLNGRIFASAKRDKAKGDFRTNIARGSKGGSIMLKPDEIELVERAARVSKCYYVGIDHVVVGGKPYIIEMNASPGSGNLYQMYDADKKPTKVVEGDRLIDALVAHLAEKSNWKLFTSVAVTDDIVVGKHNVKAKIDTGNSGYNCIHATDIVIDEKAHMVSFKLLGKHPMKERIQSRVKIRHAGSTDRSLRPVVFFDVEFAGKKFENIKFTLADRSHMRHPVLVGIRFLVQAGVQVDPSRMTGDNGEDGSEDDDVVEVKESLTEETVVSRRKKAYRKAHADRFGDEKPDVEESVLRFVDAGNPISEVPAMIERAMGRGEADLAEGYMILMDVAKRLSYGEGVAESAGIDEEYEWLVHEMYGTNDISRILGLSEDADEKRKDDLYREWRRLVNMSAKEIQSFLDSQDGKEAGLSRKEAGSAGAGGGKISSGRDSARAIIRMLNTPRDKWTANDWKWAGKQVNFISRMKGNAGDLKDDKGRPTRKLLSLKVWGHNPAKSKG